VCVGSYQHVSQKRLPTRRVGKPQIFWGETYGPTVSFWSTVIGASRAKYIDAADKLVLNEQVANLVRGGVYQAPVLGRWPDTTNKMRLLRKNPMRLFLIPSPNCTRQYGNNHLSSRRNPLQTTYCVRTCCYVEGDSPVEVCHRSSCLACDVVRIQQVKQKKAANVEFATSQIEQLS
jgi:DNA-binding transcriptional LysR family regulator